MADIKWIKLATCMPDDEKMKLIDAMPERDTIHYLWIRLLIQAAKTNADGEVFLSEDMPYTDKMLAVIFSRPLASIKLALKTLSRLGMIEIAPDKVIRIVNWDKHQNIEGMERVREQNRKRVENHREKKKLENKAAKSNKEETHEDEVLEEDKVLEENEALKVKDDLEENKTLENLEISEEASANTDKTNTATSEAGSNSSAEITDNNCTVTKNTSNVTQNKSNVTVTEQNKKEKEKKNKKEKREIESEEVKYEIQSVDTDLSEGTARLSKYHESITGKIGVLESGKLRGAIALHGEVNVKMAIDAAIKVDKAEMGYINGILSNWRRKGYPKDYVEVKKNGANNNRKGKSADKNEFAGFKPKEPRKLTADERKRIQANLI